ncbi:MAG: type II toxin-antitoxin system PemK/MazF family toxin [Spirochaetaceae bacterium]
MTGLKIERYAAYWVHLNPVVGSEIAKTRPAVVVSDNAMNEVLETIVVCPITSRLHPQWPSRVRVHFAEQAGEVAVDQIRTISRRRVGERIGVIDDAAAAQIRHIITEMYGLLSVEE